MVTNILNFFSFQICRMMAHFLLLKLGMTQTILLLFACSNTKASWNYQNYYQHRSVQSDCYLCLVLLKSVSGLVCTELWSMLVELSVLILGLTEVGRLLGNFTIKFPVILLG